MPKRSVLLTGSTGFIGRHVVRKLAQVPDLQLICIARSGERHPQAESLRRAGAILVSGHFFDDALLHEIFARHKIRQVIHLAAIRGGGNALPAEFQRVNVRGTELLLREAYECRVEKFVFCSSVGVYGTIPEHVPAGLEAPLRGDNQYHRSKIAAEEAVQSYIRKGLNAYIVRPLITYGSGDDGFPQSLVRLARRHLLWLPEGNHQIHLVSVERLAEVFLSLATKDQPQRVFVAADVEPVFLRDLVDWIHFHFYQRPYPRYLRFPDWVFRLGLRLFEAIGEEKWATRMALLSSGWYYQCADTYDMLDVRPVPTREAFGRFLQDNFPR